MAQTETISFDWKFWDKQLEAIQHLKSDEELDVVVFRGGYGSGKSFLGARMTIEFAMTYTGHFLVMGQDFAKGRDTYEVLFNQLPGNDLNPFAAGDPENSPIVEKYNHNEKRLVLKNGSVIILGSADKWNRYAGAEFNFIWCDEVAHYDNTDLYKLEEMLISRQRTENGPNISLWTSTGNGYNDFYDFVVKQETPDGDPLPTRIKNVVANSLNNPFLSEKEKLKNRFEGTQRESEALEGGFASAEGLVYPKFSRSKHVVDRSKLLDDPNDYKKIVVGADSGWHPDPRALLVIGVTGKGSLHVLDEFYRTRADTGEAIGWLKEKNYDVYRMEHDPSEPEDITDYRRAGFTCLKADNSIMSGVQKVSKYFRGVEGREILISEGCDNFIKELSSYRYPENRRSDKPKDEMNHLMDSLRYAVHALEKEVNTSNSSMGSVSAI